MPALLIERARAVIGAEVELGLLSLVVDIIEQVLDVRRSRSLGDPERAWLAETLGARLGLPPADVHAVFDVVRADRVRSTVRPEELRVMASWHGSAGTARATAGVQPAATPADFAARHGLDEGLLLFDLLVQLSVADGAVHTGEVAGLERAAADLAIDPVFVSALLSKHDPRLATSGRRVALTGDRVRIGRATTCALVLPSPQVAARHAELLRSEGGWRVVRSSRRPLLVDGESVATAPLGPDSRLRIGPYTVAVVHDTAIITDERRLSALTVRQLQRTLGDRCLLDDVGFTAFSGEVVAVVGPSGSGKTTLLQAISGVAPADSGEVLLDGEPLHALLTGDRALVAEVPQDDLVLPELTVEESLRASGRLRLSSDLRESELQNEVDRVLIELGIEDIRDSRIGDVRRRGISGGQRKRVNVGQELMTRSTRLLFLDEPLSGLDPQAAQDIVSLVRRLADQGRIVFLVTHDLSPAVMAQVDHLLVLAPGGRLAWFGPPAEACDWFEVPSPDAIFDRLRDQAPEAWRDAFHGSPAWRRCVETREHLLRLGDSPARADHRSRPRPSGALQALVTLVRRYGQVKLRDRTGLFVVIAQPVLLAAVIISVFSHTTTALLFMATLSCLWFGMSGAVRELIVDRPVWCRERRVGVGVLPYLGSKTLVLALVHAVQAAALLAVIYGAVDMQAAGVSLGPLILTGVLTAWAGVSLGLLVGAAWGSSEAAVGTLVLLLVPQIAFSGALTPLTDVSAPARAAAHLTVERYALHAAINTADQLSYRSPVRGWQTHPARGASFNLGLRPDDSEGLSLHSLWAILLGFSGLQLCATTLVVWRRER